MFPLKNKFDNTFPYKQSSLFFKSYFPLKKSAFSLNFICSLLMAYSQLKLLSFSATPFSDSSLEEKTKQKKKKEREREEKIGWN